MTQVFDFPTQLVRKREVLRQTITEILESSGASEEMVEEVTRRTLDSCLKYDASFSAKLSYTLPAATTSDQVLAIKKTIDACITSIEERVQDVMNQVLLDRLKLEIELYYLRTGSPERPAGA